MTLRLKGLPNSSRKTSTLWQGRNDAASFLPSKPSPGRASFTIIIGPSGSLADFSAYLIFMCWDIAGVIFIYLFVVETKRLSLEDMDCVFESKNPKNRSFELAGARERAKIEEQQRRAEARAEQ
jgi:hypothetical protein